MPEPLSEAARAASASRVETSTKQQLESKGILTTREHQTLERFAKLQQEKGSESTLQAMQAESQQPPIGQETINRSVQTHSKETGSKQVVAPDGTPLFKPDGTPLTNAEQNQATAEVLNKFSEKGFDALTAPEKKALSEHIVTEAERWPGYRDLFQAIDTHPTLTPTERKALRKQLSGDIVTSLVRNPNFAVGMRGNLRGTLEQAMPDLVTQAKLKVDELGAQLGQVSERKKQLRGEPTASPPVKGGINTQQERIDSFDDGAISGNKGKKIKDLETAGAEVAKFDAAEITAWQTEVVSYQKIYDTANQERAGLNPADPKFPEVNKRAIEARDALINAQKQLKNYNDAVAKRDHLQKETDDFNNNREVEEQKLTKLRLEAADLAAKELTLKSQKDAANAEYTDAQSQAGALEKQYQTNLSNVVGKTVREQLAQDLQEQQELERSDAERQAKEAKDKPTRLVNEAKLNRWTEVEPKREGFLGIYRRGESIKYDKGMLEDDLTTLVTKGPRGLMEEALTHKLAREYATELLATPPTKTLTEIQTEVNEALNDAEFMRAESNKLALSLLKQYRAAGLKIEPSMFRHIAGTEWGMGIAEELIKGDPKIDELLKQAQSKGMVPEGMTRNDILPFVLKNKGKVGLITLLGYLLATIITPVALGAVAAGSVVAIGSTIAAAAHTKGQKTA